MRAMLDVADHHWWFRGRARVIGRELDRLPIPADARILDAGCGSGQTLEQLVHYGQVQGVEVNPEAASFARARGCGEVRVGRLERLDWEPDLFDLITCLDVIEHTPDDVATLRELWRVAKPGAWLLVTVPAYPALWSRHDEINHHYRRYTRKLLRAASETSGWKVERMTSFNSILLPAAAAVRLAARRQKVDRDQRLDLERGPRFLQRALEWPFELEARWLARGHMLPAGLSLLAVLRKPPSVEGGRPAPELSLAQAGARAHTS